MAKMEGTSPQSAAAGNMLMYHVGGFSGANSVLKIIQPTFGTNTANISSTVTPEVHMKSDISEWFKNPNAIQFNTTHTVHMPGANAKTIADNYADMFSVEHIHN
jgi:hypothetical protein